MTHRSRRLSPLSIAMASTFLLGSALGDETMATVEPDRSPIALALSPDGRRLLVANQTSGSVSWVDPSAGRVLDECRTGDRPSGVALSRDGRTGVVAHWFGYDLAILGFEGDRVEVAGRVEVGPEPRGVVISADGGTAFVAVGASNEVVRVDLPGRKVTGRVLVGREPRSLAFTPDGSRLVVANNRARSLSVVDLARLEVERTLPHMGDNLRQLVVSADGRYAYFAAMNNRGFATTKNNIDQGWVLGQRLFRVLLDGSEPAENVTLDPRGQAAGDAYGLAIGEGGSLFAVGCGGTHEVMLLREDSRALPWKTGVGRDLIADSLLKDKVRFRRVGLGGRPTELAFAPDGRTLYAANYLGNSIQVIDAGSAKLARAIPLGGPEKPSIARRGEALFLDAFRSANNWYSCNTCHSDGHTNGLDFDTMNDGWHDYSSAHTQSRKKVPTLRRVAMTGPWTWHGWQTDLDEAMVESFTKSMQGKKPGKDEVDAIVTYLATLEYPRNPHREADGDLSPSAKRGEALFRSNRTNCGSCHSGPEFTDGKRHDVGLNEGGDVHRGHNPPSLRGVYDKDPYLHDGRAKTLRDALTGDHAPENLGGSTITESELDDLMAYLKSL